ncbi:unnamed protein product, partial [Pocillopora meandrina]
MNLTKWEESVLNDTWKFSSEQVKEYIEKYFKNNESMKNAVLKHVTNNENLVSFAHIPMLCYLLCFEMEYTLAESENPDDLPVSITNIYTKLVDIFELKHCAESEYRQKEIPEQFKPPSVIKNTLEKLSKLAAKLVVERKPTFDEGEMEGEFELEEVNKLKGSGLLYCDQPFRTGLITTTKHFSFTHLTVQEFLAARWFVKENCVPDEEGSEMVFQFMAGMLSSEGNEELMEKLLDSPFMHRNLKMTCLNEYQNKEFAKKFIRNNPQAFCNSDGVVAFEVFSDVGCIGVSFVLDIISELNKEEAGEAQHKCSDKFVKVKKVGLSGPQLTRSGIQRVCNSLNNKHCLVSKLNLLDIYLADECVDVINRLVVRKLTALSLVSTWITDTGVASLWEALQHPSCKLTTLNLQSSSITDTGVASLLCEALQHPSYRGSHCPFFETGFAIFNSSSKNLMATIGDRKVSAILAKIRDSQTPLILPIKSPQKNIAIRTLRFTSGLSRHMIFQYILLERMFNCKSHGQNCNFRNSCYKNREFFSQKRDFFLAGNEAEKFWIPRCGFRIPGAGFRILPLQIPDSKTQKIPDFSFWFAPNFRIAFSRNDFHNYVEGSYCSRKGLQEKKKNLVIFEKPNFKNDGAGSSAWASPFFSSKTDIRHKEKCTTRKLVSSLSRLFFSQTGLGKTPNSVRTKVSKLAQVRVGCGLPEKPTITNTETEVDKDFIVTWSEAEANSSNCSVKYRLEWRKQPVTGSTEMAQRGNIVETHLKITGLEYDTEYEVKLFAVNEQGDSEPDVRTFKTKSGMYL